MGRPAGLGQQVGEVEDHDAQDGQLEDEQAEGQDLEVVLLGRRPLAELQEDQGRDHQDGDDHRQVVQAGVGTDLGQEAVPDLLEVLGQAADGRALEDDQRQAAEEQHARQRHDERRDADVRHPEAVPGADHRPEDEAQHDREEPRHVVLGHQDRAHGTHERGDRPDGQVDVAGHDHDHHADGQDQDLGVLHHQVGDVDGLEQHPVGGDLEEDDDRREGDDHAVLPDVAAQHREQAVHVTYLASTVM